MRFANTTLPRAVSHAAAATLLLALVSTTQTSAAPSETDETLDRLERHVTTLASPELTGRRTGTEGARKAATYIEQQLRDMGLRPMAGDDDFFGPFDFTAGTRDGGSKVAVEIDGKRRSWDARDDVSALSFSDSGTVSGEVVFVGYGLVVPGDQDLDYDSYAMLDVTDKIVVALRYVPEDVEGQTRATLGRYSGLRFKALSARQRGAKALVVVTGPRSPHAGEIIPMTFDTAIAGSGIVAASVSGEVADALFQKAGKSLAEAQEALDTGNPHEIGFALDGITLELDVKVERERASGRNVIAVLDDGIDSDTAPIVIGAHYDHLGEGRSGNSLARDAEADGIHHGADDNASGVAAVIEIARKLSQIERRRDVVIGLWSGEELGLLGAHAFVDEHGIDGGNVAAYINLDMVGRSRDNKLTVQAVGSSPIWPKLIEQANFVVGFDLQTQTDPYLPTDSAAFNRAGVPSLNLFTGSHPDYHRPSDTSDKINYEDLERVVDLGTRIVEKLATDTAPIEFVEVQQVRQTSGDRDTVRAFTGTIPDYATEVEGLLLGGVMAGGPAEEAGLREGDVIVKFGEVDVKNIYDYTYALDAVKIDVPLQVVFMRDGERMETTITPRSRN